MAAKASRRSSKYFAHKAGDFPLEADFINTFVETHNKSYEESYNQVMEVMRVVQEMFLRHKRFMLPGIGIVGLAENPRRGIVLASSSIWWSPGLLNVIAAAPGWENAPLNTFLTDANIHAINRLVANVASEERINLSQFQFFNASDFGREGDVLSDEKLEYYKQAESQQWKNLKRRANVMNSMRKVKSDKNLARVKILKEILKKTEELLESSGIVNTVFIDLEKEVEDYMKGIRDEH